MKTQGHVFKYPDNVDTDVIIPARYLNTSDAKELAKHCMEDIDTEFVNQVQPGGVISNLTTGKHYQAEPFPEFIQNIIKCGGLLASLKEMC